MNHLTLAFVHFAVLTLGAGLLVRIWRFHVVVDVVDPARAPVIANLDQPVIPPMRVLNPWQVLRAPGGVQ